MPDYSHPQDEPEVDPARFIDDGDDIELLDEDEEEWADDSGEDGDNLVDDDDLDEDEADYNLNTYLDDMEKGKFNEDDDDDFDPDEDDLEDIDDE